MINQRVRADSPLGELPLFRLGPIRRSPPIFANTWAMKFHKCPGSYAEGAPISMLGLVGAEDPQRVQNIGGARLETFEISLNQYDGSALPGCLYSHLLRSKTYMPRPVLA
jgi:hypothetical protein